MSYGKIEKNPNPIGRPRKTRKDRQPKFYNKRAKVDKVTQPMSETDEDEKGSIFSLGDSTTSSSSSEDHEPDRQLDLIEPSTTPNSNKKDEKSPEKSHDKKIPDRKLPKIKSLKDLNLMLTENQILSGSWLYDNEVNAFLKILRYFIFN